MHHVLPAQKSGFANIISEPIVREVAEKHGLKWMPTKNYIIDRLPVLFSYYVLAPGRLPHGEKPGLSGWIRELCTAEAIGKCVEFIFLGAIGVGSI